MAVASQRLIISGRGRATHICLRMWRPMVSRFGANEPYQREVLKIAGSLVRRSASLLMRMLMILCWISHLRAKC